MKLTKKEEKLLRDYGEYLTQFCQRAIIKFHKGIIEHRGEDIKKLDVKKEMENEIIDLIAYQFIDESQEA